MNLRVKTAEITQELQIRTAMVMKMNHAGNAKNSVKSKNETDCRSKAKNKTSQSYSSEEDRY